ncbi:putative Stabilin-2 [Glarea lozoyensis 74030]|uniref:Putative Stabilin-2 n=1 Tax=Glarea lozoyensis (strain ATCC 74030 / MF5533) TaxID=1104152 RepID=H0EKW6_GLAL7|nr:putative Stabilin-2 [Glarea lozoyensis 74030]
MTTDQLSAILDYHLIPSQVLYTPNLTNGSTFVTANGGKITVRQGGNNLYINSAQLLNANILIANGVLHTIDNVLNPAGPDALPNPQIASQGPIFTMIDISESGMAQPDLVLLIPKYRDGIVDLIFEASDEDKNYINIEEFGLLYYLNFLA